MNPREEYMRWQRRYEDADVQRQRAENDIVDLHNRIRHLLEDINDYEAQCRQYVESAEQINKTTQDDGDITASIADADEKMELAANGLTGMGESSFCKPPNLISIFEERDRNAKTGISGAFEALKRTRQNMEATIDEFHHKIHECEAKIEECNHALQQKQFQIEDCRHIMTNASYEMAYWKQQMSAGC